MTPSQQFKLIDSVTPMLLRNVARELFDPKKMSLAVIGPYKSSKKFEKILKNWEK
ncbi:MAG: hypothetical protein R3B41_01325 [Candidatus Doudnabacteria bacterium]